jgi:hypothetical protein
VKKKDQILLENAYEQIGRQGPVNETVGIEAASSDSENILRILDNLKVKSPELYQQFVDRLMDTIENLDKPDEYGDNDEFIDDLMDTDAEDFRE